MMTYFLIKYLRLIRPDVFRGVNRTRALTSSLSTAGVGRSRIPSRVACSRTRIIECRYEGMLASGLHR